MEEDADIKKMMGFSGFGGEKKARSFDFQAIFEETRRTAQQRSAHSLAKAAEEEVKASTSAEKSHQAVEEDDEDELIGPPAPPVKQKDSDEEDLSSDDDDSDEKHEIPVSHEVSLDHGVKLVSALALDPNGARLVSGSFDYEVKFWDFGGMDSQLNAFRTTKPCESHAIVNLEYSISGDKVLVVSGSAQAKVLDRDAFEVLECPKGYPYIADPGSNRGHIGMLTGGCWHPKKRDIFVTSSLDSSLRLWNVETASKKSTNVVRPRGAGGRRVPPTACCFSRDGNLLMAALQDGSIHGWDTRKHYVNTALKLNSAHQNGSDTSCICFSYSGNTLASRGGDDTVKLWDIRNFKQPLVAADGFYNRFGMTDVTFSPNDRLVATGVSHEQGKAGAVVFLDINTLEPVYQIVQPNTSAVRVLWHPKLHQIAVGLSDGNIRLFYDPDRSFNGAKLCVVKTQRKKQQVEMMVAENIIAPFSIPGFRGFRNGKVRVRTPRDAPVENKYKKPEMPMSGAGSQGRLGHHGATLNQYVMKTIAVRKKEEDDFDIRNAILRHKEEAEKNPFYIAKAYHKNQPKPIFQEKTKSQAEEDEKKGDDIQPVWKRAKRDEN